MIPRYTFSPTLIITTTTTKVKNEFERTIFVFVSPNYVDTSLYSRFLCQTHSIIIIVLLAQNLPVTVVHIMT